MNRGDLMNLKIIISSIFVIVFIGHFHAAGILAFSDADLERYQQDNIRINRTERNEQIEQTISKQPQSEQRNNAQYWCEKGRSADDRVSTAALNVARLSGTAAGVTAVYGDRYSGSQAIADAHLALDVAEKELDATKKDRARLHEDAHRLNVPAGWLRCQFE